MILSQVIKQIFISAQKCATSHPKIIQKLIKVYLHADFEEFFTTFIHHVKHCLIVGEKQTYVDRTLTFVGKFAVSVKSSEEEDGTKLVDGEIDQFLVKIFKFLLENHEANNKAVRFRICQLINHILNNMGETACIDDELYNVIYETMLQRLMDKMPAVRVQAVLALGRLQEPTNKECPVIKAYMYHLCMDPNPEVRKTVLTTMAITFHTLPGIFERIRDVKDTVRRLAYLTLSQKVHLKSFTIAQRVLLISEGLNDRSESVRIVVKKNLLQGWLRLSNGNVLELLTCLDVETSKESAVLALSNLFENVPYSTLLENFNILNDKRVIDETNMKPEAALYWNCLANHFRTESAEEHLEEILPDLTYFCEYLKDYIFMEVPAEEDPQETAVKVMEKDFICQQLLSMTCLFDLSDEVGRQSLNNLVRDLFLSNSISVVCIDNLAEIFSKLYPPISRINIMAELISDLRDPAIDVIPSTPASPPKIKLTEQEQRKNKLKLAKISVQLNQVRDELEDCVRTLNLERAQKLKVQLEELEEMHNKLMATEVSMTLHIVPQVAPETVTPTEDEEAKPSDDPVTLIRCLNIIACVISNTDITTLSSTLRSLHDNLILPSLKSEDPELRKHAVKSLALVCLIAKDLALLHLTLLVQISQVDVEDIQIVALKGVFDILQLYGVEDFDNDAAAEKSNDSLSPNQDVSDMISTLSNLLEDERREIRTCVAEGLCKLLLTSRITSSKLLSLLIIQWYNPNTEEDNLFRHMLGVFFTIYAAEGGAHQEALCGAVLPTLSTILNAPSKSPLTDIDAEDVASFLVSITSPAVVSQKAKEKVNAHDSFVFSLCSEIISVSNKEDDLYTKVLVKCLNRLTLTPTKFASLKQIEILAQKIIQNLNDRSTISVAEKFRQSVKNFLKFAPVVEEDEDTADDTETSLIAIDSTQSNSTIRRKRTLYTSHADMELTSDPSESESEKDMSKKEKLTEDASVISSVESENETLVRTVDEIELSSAILDSVTKKVGEVQLTSSDLFNSKTNSAADSSDGSVFYTGKSTTKSGLQKDADTSENEESLFITPNESAAEDNDTPSRVSTRLIKRRSQNKERPLSKTLKTKPVYHSPITKTFIGKESQISSPHKRKNRSSSKTVSSSSQSSSGSNSKSLSKLPRSESLTSQSSGSSSESHPFKKKQRKITSSLSSGDSDKVTAKDNSSEQLKIAVTRLRSPYLAKFINSGSSESTSTQPHSSRSSTRSKSDVDRSISLESQCSILRSGTRSSKCGSSSESTSVVKSATRDLKKRSATESTPSPARETRSRRSASSSESTSTATSSVSTPIEGKRRSNRSTRNIEGRKNYASK